MLSKAKCVPNLGPNFCVTSSVLDESKTMTNESAGTTRMDLSRLKPINRRRSFTSSSEPDQDEGEGEKRRKFLERNRYLDYRNEHPTVILITKLFEKSCGFPFASEKKMLGVEFGSENHVDEQCQQVAAEWSFRPAQWSCPVKAAAAGPQGLSCHSRLTSNYRK